MAAKYIRASVHRNWKFTSFADEIIATIQLRIPEVRYARVQEEFADQTGKKHWQGYICFHGTKSLTAVKLFLCDPQAHLTKVIKKEAAYDYVHKTETQGLIFWEYGTPLSAGMGYKELDNRMRIEGKSTFSADALADRLDKGMQDIKDVERNFPKLYRDLVKLHPRYKIKEPRSPLKVLYIYGKGGLGKTEFRAAFAKYLDLEAYLFNGTSFYEGITSDVKILGIDEFVEEKICMNHFNTIVDNLEPLKPVKNSSVHVNAEFLLITSNKQAKDVYTTACDTMLKTFLRRIEGFMHVEEHSITENKITLRVVDPIAKLEEEHVFYVPIRRPTNEPQCNLIVKTFLSILIKFYSTSVEGLFENKTFIETYKDKA